MKSLHIGQSMIGLLVLTAVAAVCIMSMAPVVAADSGGAQSWIWHPEQDPDALGVPACTRYFRKTIELEEEPTGGYLRVTADDEFTLWVNGEELGSGSTWQELYSFDLKDVLRRGRNVIAVSATNTAGGPAALLVYGAVAIGGDRLAVSGDETWKAAQQAPEGWQAIDFDDGDWVSSVLLASTDEGPWAGGINLAMSGPVENAFEVQATLSELHLVPQPREIELGDGSMPLTEGFAPGFEIVAPERLHDSYAIEQISRALGVMSGGLSMDVPVVTPGEAGDGPRLAMAIFPVDGELAQMCAAAGYDGGDLRAQGYFLGVEPSEETAAIVAADLPGLIYGSSTLIQLISPEDGGLAARDARVLDWPAWQMRGPRSIGVSEAVADWCAFYKMNVLVTGFDWEEPLPERFVETHEMLTHRGILFMPECHPGGYPEKPFIFTNPEHRQALLNRTREAIEMGLPAIGFMVDDRPNEPESPEDVEKYGEGLVGLGKAQMEMMTEIAEFAGDRIDIYFCPRVYYDPYQQGIYPTEPADQEMQYRKMVGTLPENVEIWTTQPKLSYLRELNEVWGREPVIYHNLFYSGLADEKLFFIPYPTPTEEHVELTPGGVAAGSGLRYAREWLVNYLSFAANTWNPEAALGLRPCFVREYGEAAADALVEYAIGLNGQIEPGVPIMADVWDQPDQYACVRMGMGFAGRLRHLKANDEDIAKLRKWAEQARRSVEVDWSGTGFSDEQIRTFELNARRVWLNYVVLADILTLEKQKAAGEEISADDERLQQCITRAEEIRGIIEALRVSQERAADWKLLDRAHGLADG